MCNFLPWPAMKEMHSLKVLSQQNQRTDKGLKKVIEEKQDARFLDKIGFR